jgi:hypothetical protein
MIFAAVAILVIVFILLLLRRNRRSKLPEYLKGKKVEKTLDLITEREVYIATHRDLETRDFIHKAYFCDDGTECEHVLYQQAYGIMYCGGGNLRLVPKKVAREFLEAIAQGRKPIIEFHRRGESGEGKG